MELQTPNKFYNSLNFTYRPPQKILAFVNWRKVIQLPDDKYEWDDTIKTIRATAHGLAGAMIIANPTPPRYYQSDHECLAIFHGKVLTNASNRGERRDLYTNKFLLDHASNS
ncbi:hypothetical protein RUND412_010512 [Rhizina undulata]